jgi:hypothetical protein
METGFRGAFVISWSQTEVDGLAAAPVGAVRAGASWAWHGDAVRVDGPNDILRLERQDDPTTRRRCAAKMVRRLVSAAGPPATRRAAADTTDPVIGTGQGFVVTDGRRSHAVTVIPVGGGAPPLLMFVDDMPPRGRELWVVQHTLDGPWRAAPGRGRGGVICFTPGTSIATPAGPRPVEALRAGDAVQTVDSGPQPVRWIGRRRISGARLVAMPHLRPVRLRVGALGIRQPDQELLVSPGHRVLVRGAVARSLFNTPEVLVAAGDLVNDATIAVDPGVREVSYIHLLLPRHEVIWANGVQTESFHPASAAPGALAEADRARLLEIDPALVHHPDRYGDFARRALSAPEAAILSHEAA